MKAGKDKWIIRFLSAFLCLFILVVMGAGNLRAEDTHTPLEPVSCPGKGGEGEVVECYILHVPSDWNDIANRPMELPVMRFAPLGGKASKPPLLILGGGPGQSVIHLQKQIASNLKLFREDRELVLMDQRGTGPLAEDVQCQEAVGEDDTISIDKLVDCAREAEKGQHYLSDYSTDFAAEDYHALRNALHIDQWAVMATSYGARVAQALVRRDEKGIERIVFNGPLFISTRFFDWNPFAKVESTIELCNEQDTCRSVYPDLYWDFQRLPFEMRKVKLANEKLPAAIYIFLYRNRLQALLARHRIADVPADIVKTARSVAEAIREDKVWTPPPPLAPSMKGIGLLMHFAILCAEDIAPLDGKTFNELDQPLQVSYYRSACQRLTEVSRHTIKLGKGWDQAARTSKPILILNGEYDTIVDSEASGQVLSLYPNGRWIEVPFMGHDQVSRVACARQITESFLSGTAPGKLKNHCMITSELAFHGPDEAVDTKTGDNSKP